MGKLEWSREERKASWTGSLARTPERGTMCVGRCRHKELGECEGVCAWHPEADRTGRRERGVVGTARYWSLGLGKAGVESGSEEG